MKRLDIIPIARYKVGDEVVVRCLEAGFLNTFNAIVFSVIYNKRTKENEYGVYCENGWFDGYTEDWLSPMKDFTCHIEETVV